MLVVLWRRRKIICYYLGSRYINFLTQSIHVVLDHIELSKLCSFHHWGIGPCIQRYISQVLCKYICELAHKMTFVCFGLFWLKNIQFKFKLDIFFTFMSINPLVQTLILYLFFSTKQTFPKIGELSKIPVTVTRKLQVNSNGRMERLMCNFHLTGYYCSPNLSIHQNST